MNYRPKILFSMSTMLGGGIEKSAITLFKSLKGQNLDLTLLLNEKKGLFMNQIPEWVNVRTISYAPEIVRERTLGRKKMLRSYLVNFKLFSFIKYYLTVLKENRLYRDDRLIHSIRRYENSIIDDNTFKEEYDLAVAYANFEQMILVGEKIKARRKIAFFHTQLEGLTTSVRSYYYIFKRFDSLYCVSKDLRDSMINTFPELEDRIKYFPHIIDTNEIRTLGNAYRAVWPGVGIRLLSVGRFEKQKGFDLIPEIALKLRNDNIPFQWQIIGDGITKSDISEEIEKSSLETSVFLPGVKLNPYPFFSSCDIYVQPSRYEGYCLTLAEARVFAKPIIATFFDGSIEQLEGGKCGKLVKFDPQSIFEAIKELYFDAELRNKYSKALQHQQVGNTIGVEIFQEEIRKSVLQ